LAGFSPLFLSSQSKQIAQIFVGLPNRLLAALFFVLGVILIFLYRRAMVRLTEESVFFRHQASPVSFFVVWNTRAAAKQRNSFYSKKGFWPGGYRGTFECFLNLLDQLNAPRKTKAFTLSVLKNYMDTFSFASAAYLIIIVFISIVFFSVAGMGIMSGYAFYGIYFWWMWVVILTMRTFLRNRGLKQDAAKPISRNRLFITDYAGTYLVAVVMMVELWIAVKLGMLAVSSTAALTPLFPGILAAFLMVSLLLMVRRFIKNSLIPFVIFMPTTIFAFFPPFSYLRPVIFQNMVRFSNPALYLAVLPQRSCFQSLRSGWT